MHKNVINPLASLSIYYLLLLLCISATYILLVATTHADQDTNNAKTKSIRFAVLPYLSTKALIKKWKPFAEQLGRKLGKNVAIKTAQNYTQFISRVSNYKYDIILTAPHFAVLAQQESNYQIIAGFSKQLSGDITVLQNSPFKTLQDLRGKIVTTPDKLAVVTILGELLFQKANINPHRDLTIKNTPSHNSAILSVTHKKSDAAIAVGNLYKKINKNSSNKLRLLAKTQRIPHVMFIVNPHLSQQEIDLFRNELLNKNNTDFQYIIKSFKWGKLQPIQDSAIKKLQPLIPLLKSRMKI